MIKPIKNVPKPETKPWVRNQQSRRAVIKVQMLMDKLQKVFQTRNK
jgi:hypothetical protein